MSEQESQKPKISKEEAFQRLSALENAVLGVFAGSLEVTCLQPILYCKNAAQQKIKLVFDPRIMYRGLLMSITNMAVLTGLQFPLTGMMTRLLTGGKTRRLSDAEIMCASLCGGAISGIACAPMELVMIQQQRWGGNILATPARLASTFGLSIFSRGLITSSGREGLFCAGYLGISPVVARNLSEKYNCSNYVANIWGAVMAGLISSALSHPFDTIKTCMQGDVERKTYTTMTQSGLTLYKEGGMLRLYRGWGWRAGRAVVGMFILSLGKSTLGPLLFPQKFE
eukprot:TRINITY_DN366_c0_g1_i1.p1 TRINITY_DN366_c0_g1~~TRINITY_DN366_c0_g1_i1.p1  ORF type:complete len:283 (+),score=38.08 TRINITY_DN366_c0_g1_i1:182-1030(+)